MAWIGINFMPPPDDERRHQENSAVRLTLTVHSRPPHFLEHVILVRSASLCAGE